MPNVVDKLVGETGDRGLEIRGVDASTGQALEPAFRGASEYDVDQACRAAAAAFDAFRASDAAVRAGLLEAIAANLESMAPELIARCGQESGLPRARLEGELTRTTFQLRLFAGVVRDGVYLDLRIDPALADRLPTPRPDLRLRNIPLGPVAVFGASNFPLAFSVAGGDTASALAAGCPVVVKAHNAHPGTSDLVARAVQKAVADCRLPAGIFALIFDAGQNAGQALVAHPAIQAVAFTGSRAGGLALLAIAQQRPTPIPVYAEMSAINPVLLMPAALAKRGVAIGAAYVAATTLGAGQFCTNPGLLLVCEGPGLEAFLDSVAEAVAVAPSAVMLTAGIHQAFAAGVGRMRTHPGVALVGEGQADDRRVARPAIFATSAEAFLTDPALHAEVFGAASLIVRCRDLREMADILTTIEGQLTIAVHADQVDHPAVAALLPLLERKAGRIVFNGFGTGVEVGHAMVHGGPFPATSDGRQSSVGSLAIRRFLRPIAYQALPQDLLPPELRDHPSSRAPRLIDGTLEPR